MTSGLLNADKLIEKLGKISKIDLKPALNSACIIVENDAKRNCVVGDTGELRASITHEVEGNTGVVGTNKSYAPYVEIGTGIFSSMGNGRKTRWSYQDVKGEWHSTIGQHPQPYLKPALDTNEQKVIKEIKKKAKEEIDKQC